jgi:uncharacterized protein YkwD
MRRRLLLSAIAVGVVAACVGLPRRMFKASSGLLGEHNRERGRNGLSELSLDRGLCSYAQKHAERMASSGRLFHSSMSALSEEAGNGSVGENIAWGQETEEQAFSSWMNSTPHRRNILTSRFKRAGFGVKEDRKGRKYWCAVFAS